MTPSTRRTFLTLGLWGSLALLAALAFRRLERPRSAPPIDARLEQLDVVPLANGARPLTRAELEGKTVLINFWGTWCPPCREEFPHLAALEKQYRGRNDFLLLSISATGRIPEDVDGLREETEAFLRGGNYELPIYADPSGNTRRGLRMAVDSSIYPATVLIDRSGRVAGAWEGFLVSEFDEIKLKIAGLLQAK
ncbi:MAG: TlpA family protein disulfide reductase [Planctomycetia bacterium]|nr:TlpA family protein disulfide reductase [Planctomycetia bacterium]